MAGFSYLFDDLKLADLMIQDERNKLLYEKETAQKIVEAQFQKSKQFFQSIFILYVLGYLIPFALVFTDSFVEKKTLWLNISLVTLCLFFILACIKIKGSKRSNVLRQLSETTDFLHFICYLCLWYLGTSSDSNELGEDLKTNRVLEIVLVLVVVTMSFAKILGYLRIYESYGFLVKMVALTFRDLIPFTIFFLLFIVFFASLYIVLKLDLDEEVYVDVKNVFGYFLYSMRNSIGDLSEPLYTVWLEEENQVKKYTMIYIAWFVWICNALLMVIVLLNFLIAVISQSYERVVSL